MPRLTDKTFVPNNFGKQIFQARYAAPSEEHWHQRCDVVAKDAASCESPEVVEKITNRFYRVTSQGDFVPGGRILFGAGRARQNRLNCYVLVPEDTVESIGQTIKDMYKISCGGGGVGFNFYKIRPKGDDIQNIRHSAPGSISVMKMINEIAEHVRSGGGRRTALMALLNVDHPDLLEFLHVKLDKGELNNFNISVAMTDEFIEACNEDRNWSFKFNGRDYHVFEMDRISPKLDDNGDIIPDQFTTETIRVVGYDQDDALARANEHYKTHWNDQFHNPRFYELKAMEIFAKIWHNAFESGDPGIFNLSMVNNHTNVGYFEGLLMACNPCGEANLPNYGNCCLGHVNLANFVNEDTGEFDWNGLKYAVKSGVRFLDNILTVNHFPIEKCRTVSDRSRRIGLGVMGYHYMLIKLGIRYGSENCLVFTDRLFNFIKENAYLASAYLAKEKGAFPEYNSEEFLKQPFAKTLTPRTRFIIREYGMRNAIVLSIAPTGTTSMVMGVSSGIEPIFAPMYYRRWRDRGVIKREVVLDPLFKKYVDEGRSLNHFVGAYDVTPEEHMAVQAAVQRHIDQAISKTINVPEDANALDFVDVALKYIPDLKGLTIYRAGSKPNEPIEAIPTTAENIKKFVVEASDSKEEVSGAICNIGDGSCGDV